MYIPMKGFLEERGIQPRSTALYSPPLNDVAERLNWTLRYLVRSMLHQNSFPMKWWAQALPVATHVRNYSHHSWY